VGVIGKTVGKYRIVARLGRGGMGTVYKAIDTTLQREVAIKILNADHADTSTAARFRAEATILASLNHPEIATIHEFFPSETDLLMVVEFVRGATLEKVSDALGPMPTDQSAYVIDKMLSALEHTHRAGIVHRDLKPANVMITEHGSIKIMDFGVARACGGDRMTLDGTLMGTPAYMAPEQVLGNEVDGRADLYSVGVVFYRLLTGVLPFTAESAVDMLQKQLSETPTPLHVHRTDLPDWCEPIVQRALAKSTDDRFQNAAEFREALRDATGLIASSELARLFSITVAELESTQSRQTGVLAEDTAALDTPSYSFRSASSLTILSAGVIVLAVALLWRPGIIRVTKPRETTRPPVIQRPAPAPAPVPMPFVFDARMVLADGGKRSERDCRVVLIDKTIRVQPKDAETLLRQLPYDAVVSISYSRGRRPLWNTKEGPTPVLTLRPAVFDLFRGDRYWVTIRTKNAKSRFLVLRLPDEMQARRAIDALEERTGRTAQTVVERSLDE
jgi:serine/threonine protein kinase